MAEGDVVSEPLEQGGGGADRSDAIGMKVAADRVPVEQPDSQAAGIDSQLVDVRATRRGRDDAVADARSVDGVEHPCGVTHRSAHTQLGGEPGLVAFWPHRHATL